MSIIKGLDNVVIDKITTHPTTIPNYEYKTRIVIKGVNYSLWHLGDVTNFYSSGCQVSIIYEDILVHGYIQKWIHLIDDVDLTTLEARLSTKNNNIPLSCICVILFALIFYNFLNNGF